MLAILTTHPIQYQVPLWRELARRGEVNFEVWYMSDQGARRYRDAGFGQDVQWDIPLLEGYPFRFVATRPSPANLDSFRGVRLRGLSAILREANVSALLITGWYLQAYLQGAFTANRLGIPVWLRGETNDLTQSSALRTIPRSILLHLLFRRIDRFFYIGSANRRLYSSFGVPEQRLVPALYCVDNARFAASADAANLAVTEIRRRWAIAKDAACFLLSGKLVHKKRPLDLIRAATIVAARRPDLAAKIHVLVVGSGELLPAMEQAAADLDRLCGKRTVSFTGFLNQTEIGAAYAIADWLVLPSNAGETWGLVANESLAAGTPILVSDQCGCAEDLASPLGEGCVFPCGDIETLARRLEDIVVGHLVAPTSDRCRDLVARFDISCTADSVTREYLRLHSDDARRSA